MLLLNGIAPAFNVAGVHLLPSTGEFTYDTIPYEGARAGVAQFFKSNQREMMRAVNNAVRDGAHLGLRRLAGS